MQPPSPGPMVLAGLTSSDKVFLPARDPATLAKIITRVHPEGDLRFELVSPAQPDCPSSNHSFALVPFADVTNRLSTTPYTVYFHTKGHHFSAFTPPGETAIQLATSADLAVSGGASVVPNGPPHHHRGHATHMALENPQHKHFPHPGYDVKTGNHYGHPKGETWNIRSGNPHEVIHSNAKLFLVVSVTTDPQFTIRCCGLTSHPHSHPSVAPFTSL